MNLAATASDPDGSVAKVEFFNGAAKLGEDTTAPYSYSWSGVAAGGYTLTARATDNLGASTTSAASTITVNAQQLAGRELTQPADGATFVAPATVNIGGDARPTPTARGEGRVLQRRGEARRGHDRAVRLTAGAAWPAGTYTLTARATDNLGAATTSVASTITVNLNTLAGR